MVMGEGRNPKIDDLIKLGQDAKLDRIFIQETIERTRSALSEWPQLSKEYGVSSSKRADITSMIVP